MAQLIQLESVKEFAAAIELDLATVVQQFTIKAFNGFVERTPVDTGRLRSNWQVGIGNIPEKQLSSTGEPKPPPIAEIKGDKTVFIVNNLDYAEAIENGHSKKSPLGMVAITMARLQGEIDANL